MWKQFELAYFCMPASASFMVQAIHALDSARNFRVNAVTYGILEGGTWTPAEQNWRNWFKQQFGLTFVVQVPPENSYFALEVPLWTLIYNQLDIGLMPDQDFCWLLKFPASQGGAWPVRWPV